jgi:hypothetical protein
VKRLVHRRSGRLERFDETDIEKILEKRAMGRGYQFRIRWKGAEEDSWVPASKVTDLEILAAWNVE